MSSRILLVFLFASLTLNAGSCSTLIPVDAELTNLSATKTAVLKGAQDEACWLLKSLCVDLRWHDRPSGATTLKIQILVQPLIPTHVGCLGLAVPSLGHAAVFSQRVREVRVGGESNLSPSNILGNVIAHELGHLLLRSLGHSDRGLMSAAFGEEELLAAGQRRLLFTDSDRQAMADVYRSGERLGLVAEANGGSGAGHP